MNRLFVTLAVILFASSGAGSQQLEKVKLITSTGIESFVKDLNDNGKLGYRLENSLNYGGEGVTQSFAAVLRLDAPNKYEYDWMSSPDKMLLEERLNSQAKKGFNFANAYALTYCSEPLDDESDPNLTLVLRLKKGDAFLLERRNGTAGQTREYKVLHAKVRLGDSAEKDIQAALDAAAPQGFRPVKILFARYGLLDFTVSVLTEKSLMDGNSSKTEYRFLKKSSGLPDHMNKWAAQGFRFITGRRVGSIGLVLMDKQTSDGTKYTMIDRKKYAKEFDKTIAQGNSYRAVMLGDLTCGSTEAGNERLVFEQNSGGKQHEYKIAASNEFQQLVSDGYQIKDLFYSKGLHVIFER